eukprot:360968-Chlamydomonas_euryale.AAC.2
MPWPGMEAMPWPGTAAMPWPGTAAMPWPGMEAMPWPGTAAMPWPGMEAAAPPSANWPGPVRKRRAAPSLRSSHHNNATVNARAAPSLSRSHLHTTVPHPMHHGQVRQQRHDLKQGGRRRRRDFVLPPPVPTSTQQLHTRRTMARYGSSATISSRSGSAGAASSYWSTAKRSAACKLGLLSKMALYARSGMLRYASKSPRAKRAHSATNCGRGGGAARARQNGSSGPAAFRRCVQVQRGWVAGRQHACSTGDGTLEARLHDSEGGGMVSGTPAVHGGGRVGATLAFQRASPVPQPAVATGASQVRLHRSDVRALACMVGSEACMAASAACMQECARQFHTSLTEYPNTHSPPHVFQQPYLTSHTIPAIPLPTPAPNTPHPQPSPNLTQPLEMLSTQSPFTHHPPTPVPHTLTQPLDTLSRSTPSAVAWLRLRETAFAASRTAAVTLYLSFRLLVSRDVTLYLWSCFRSLSPSGRGRMSNTCQRTRADGRV